MNAADIQPETLTGFRNGNDQPSPSPSDDQLFDQFLSAPRDDPDDAVFDGFVHNTAPQMARQKLDDYKAGKIDLDQDHVESLSKVAQDGVGAWESLGHSVRYIFGHPDETIKGIGNVIVSGAKGLAAGGEALSHPEKQLASDLEAGHPIDALWNYGINKYKLAKEIGEGSAKGLTGLAPALGGAAAEATELATEPFVSDKTAQDLNAKLNAGTYQAENLKNRAFNYIAKVTGVDPNQPAYALAEQAAPLALPVGGSEKAAKTVEKVGDVILDKGTRILGQGIKAIGRTGQIAAPSVLAAGGAAVMAHGHPIIGAEMMLPLAAQVGGHEIMRHGYGVGRYATALAEAPWNYLYEQGKFLSSVPEGETVLGWARQGMESDLDRLSQQLEDIKSTNGGKVDKAFKTTNDGQRLYPTDSLKGPELEARQAEDKMIDLQRRIGVVKGYENINRAMSAAVRTGLKMGLDGVVAGTIGGAYAGSTESPGEYETARQGFEAGAAIGLAARAPRIPLMIRGELRNFNRGDLIRSGQSNITPDHPYYEEHNQAMSTLPQTAKDYVHTYSGLAQSNGRKIVVLPDADFASEAGTDIQESPNGFYDRKTQTAYAKQSALQSGVIPHEVGHAFEEAAGWLDEGHPVNKAVDQMLSNPKFKTPVQNAVSHYRELRQSDPTFEGLSQDDIKSEIVADLASDIMQKETPEGLYGGRSLAQKAGAVLQKLLPRKPTQTSGFGWPVTPELRDAVADALFKAGQEAAHRLPAEFVKAGGGLPTLSADESKARQDAIDAINSLNKNLTKKSQSAVANQVDQAISEMKASGKPIDPQKIIAATQQRKTRIVGPALTDTQGKVIEQGQVGDTHADLITRAASKDVDATDATHAFVDQEGNVLNREQAAPVALSAGQAPEGTTSLHSEDLKAVEPETAAVIEPVSSPAADFVKEHPPEKYTDPHYEARAALNTLKEIGKPFEVGYVGKDLVARQRRVQFGVPEGVEPPKGGRKTTSKPGLYTVYDHSAEPPGWRTIDINRIRSISGEGVDYHYKRSYMPREEPKESQFSEKIVSPAIRVNDIPFIGKTYEEAQQKARDFGFEPKEVDAAVKGYTTNKGKWLTPDEASTFTAENRQMGKQAEGGPLRTQDFNRWRRYMPVDKEGSDVVKETPDERGVSGISGQEGTTDQSAKAQAETSSFQNIQSRFAAWSTSDKAQRREIASALRSVKIPDYISDSGHASNLLNHYATNIESGLPVDLRTRSGDISYSKKNTGAVSQASSFAHEQLRRAVKSIAGISPEDQRLYMPQDDAELVNLGNGLTPEENKRYLAIKSNPLPSTQEADEFDALTKKISDHIDTEAPFRKQFIAFTRENPTEKYIEKPPDRFYADDAGFVYDRLTGKDIDVYHPQNEQGHESTQELVDSYNNDNFPLPLGWTGSHPDAWIPEWGVDQYPGKTTWGISGKPQKQGFGKASTRQLYGEYPTREAAETARQKMLDELYTPKEAKSLLQLEGKRFQPKSKPSTPVKASKKTTSVPIAQPDRKRKKKSRYTIRQKAEAA